LKNYTNKEKFVKLLAERLEVNGIEVVRCPSDADTTIVKVAMRYDPGTLVVIFSDDTDILCLLLHHVNDEHESPNIFLMNMSRQKANKVRECYNIKIVIDEAEGMFLGCFLICS
jgi:5'-3' exonuclease